MRARHDQSSCKEDKRGCEKSHKPEGRVWGTAVVGPGLETYLRLQERPSCVSSSLGVPATMGRYLLQVLCMLQAETVIVRTRVVVVGRITRNWM